MKLGIDFENIKVDNTLIVNGHHRYICGLLCKKEIKTSPWVNSPGNLTYVWPEIEVEENDYESIDEVKQHNINDAETAGCDVAIFSKLVESWPNYS